MGRIDRDVYRPDPARAEVYDDLYAEYVQLHDYFGRGGNDVMKRLKALRRKAIASKERTVTAAATTGGEAA